MCASNTWRLLCILPLLRTLFGAAALIAAEPLPMAAIQEVHDELSKCQGVCVLVDTDITMVEAVKANSRVLVHILTSSPPLLDELRTRELRSKTIASTSIELWSANYLPHADKLANLIILGEGSAVARSEAQRVLAPGGIGLFQQGEEYEKYTKPVASDTDEWTHQWHGPDGGLVTNDQSIGVPQGIQWLSGPLFAMAGRKSSTQSLVTSGGVNYYVTQNVIDNIGKSEMAQHLVAYDAYNGIMLWQKPWTGPFVTGDGETNARIVATPDRLFAAGDNRLLVFAGRSGELLGEIALEAPADKLLVAGEQVYVQSSTGVVACAADLQQPLWEFPVSNSSGLVLNDQRAYLLVRGRASDGSFKHELLCLDRQTGKLLWRANTQPHVTAASVQINFVQDGYVALQAHGSLHLFSALDGRHLWSRTTEALPGKDYVDERYVGHFYRHGLVWMLMGNSPRENQGQCDWVGLNPNDGKVVRKLETSGEWPRTATPAKMGCQVLIASDKYIMIPRQATFIDFDTGEKLPFKFTRGGCGLGFVPANGLVYSHPHACGCFSEAIRGFMGMHSTPGPLSPHAGQASEQRLTEFVSVAKQPPQAATEDWPMYRGDRTRGAFHNIRIMAPLGIRWTTPIASAPQSLSARAWLLRNGNPVTQATSAGDTVYAADVNQGIVYAMDRATGEPRWQFTANGRIDSPPTLYAGLCLFGSHDGYVYCLNASNGQLAWRFRAAPTERRIVAYGGLESTWPVAGTVLLRDGIAYVAAGRAPDADGGISVHALDPFTGELKWTRQLSGDKVTGLCDFLIGDDQYVYLSNWQFDPLSGKHRQASEEAQHLRGGKVGLLESSWTKHDLALRKDLQTWSAQGVTGQLVAFSAEHTVCYNAEGRQLELVDRTRSSAVATIPIEVPEQVTAVALTREFAIIGGGRDRADTSAGGFLRLVDLKTARVVESLELPAEVVFDGISIAHDEIFVATHAGQLHCISTR